LENIKKRDNLNAFISIRREEEVAKEVEEA